MNPRYAGLVSRALGRALDMVLLAMLIAGTSWLFQQFFGIDPARCPQDTQWWHLRARLCRYFPYLVPLAGVIVPPLYRLLFFVVAGQTPGMGVMGLRLLRENGRRVGFRQALKRVAAFYFTFGLGSLLIPVTARRRALHDILAGTVVVYDWGDREHDVRRAIEEARAVET